MKLSRGFTLSALLSLSLIAQTPMSKMEPDIARMKKDLYYLAGPECMGRGTGEVGQTVAAAYIAKEFKAAGLEMIKGNTMNGYLFSYPLKKTTVNASKMKMTLGALSLNSGSDYETMASTNFEGELVRMNGSDLTQVGDLKGKMVLMILGSENPMQAMQSASRPLMQAGAIGILYGWSNFGPDQKKLMDMLKSQGGGPRLSIPNATGPARPGRTPRFTAWLTEEGLQKIQGAFSEGLKVSFQAGTNEEMINATNVVGVIPGTDPVLKNEYVVISAHHDHLGGTKEDYYPGADDDASGTTGLMELARQLRTTKNKRSILFLSVSGEEKGLLGSESFLLNPPIPVNQMVANVNIDMIGRMETTRVDVAPARIEKGVSELTQYAREIATSMGINLTAEADKYWLRSDHYNFFKRGIPALFFFDGMGDVLDYHQKTDTADKINYEKIALIVKMTYGLLRTTANADKAPRILEKSEYESWTWATPPTGAGQ